jgi:hypothetical protein
MRKIFVLWLLLLSVVSLAQPYSVKQLGIEKGLSNNYVVSIAQDKQGFLWFATEEGLNKFDGTRFITYLKNEDLTRQGITGNELNCLLDDPQDSILWIGTQRAGLNAYDYVNNTFLCYRHDGENPESLITDDVTKIVAATDGNLWITTYWRGVDYFDKKAGKFIHYNTQTVPGLASDNIWSVVDGGDGKLYMGHVHHGFSVLSLKDKKVTNFMHDPEDPVSLPGNGVTCIYKDLSGNIWLGTDRGLALFNPEAENFIHFHHSEDGVPHTVFDIRQFDGNKLWIAMEFGGIAILDLTQRMFLSPDQVRFQYIKEGDDEYSLSNSTVRCLFQDSFKNVWAGMWGGGINFLSHESSYFNVYSYSPIQHSGSSLNNKTASSVCVARDGKLWIGTDVDGQNPTMTLATDHIESGAGHRFTIEGTLEDKDGIASISLQCADLHLNKTIDLIEIYGAPQESYDLSYYFDINRNEIGERFTVKVTVTDIGGRSISQDVLITMDGDFAAPVFSAAPDATVTVLMKNETKFNLRFTATDDRALDYVTINIPGIDGFDNRRVDADGKSSLNFAEIIVFPNEPKSYNVTITAFDKKENSTTTTSVLNISEMPDFPKMYLADVATAEELNSDIFGVPMVIEHTGEYQYKANYYCQKAGTKIFFLPQKSDFTPICFGLDPEDNTKLTDDPETAMPIVLDQANVYYEINIDVKNSTYNLKTYSIADAVDPIPHTYGSISLDTWGDGGSWLQEFYFGYMTSSPTEVLRFTQDKTNPHLFYLDTPLFLEAGTKMNFVIHNWHSDGWWNYCTWRVDNSDEPEIFGYYGKEAK